MSLSKTTPLYSSIDDYYDLGDYHRPVTTTKKTAQTWFNRGLIWTYGFNHEEAAECFEKAISDDPKCSMAYWGLAYCLGPNYNKPWTFFEDQELERMVQRTHRAVETAKSASTDATPVEKALITALHARYPQDKPIEKCSIWNHGYATAMGVVYQEFPDDLDVATLYADALMNLTPWALWDLNTGEPAPKARTLEIKQVLDRALGQEGGLSHPGVLHLYIHLMEMSPYPESALPTADHLRALVPDSGHLNHMPTHLDLLCGEYANAITSNSAAIVADEKFLVKAGSLNFYTLYRSHDYHFRIYAAMFAGQSQIALDTVWRLEASIPEDLLRVKSPPMADWLEAFLAMRIHVLVRFGRWQDIIDLSLPNDQALYCTTVAMIHFGKGVAYAATGRIKDAEVHRDLFRKALELVGQDRTLFNNTCRDILAIASAMLDGELEYRRHNYTAAFKYLLESIKLEDQLPYDEPWGWMMPSRHAYGALLLEQGHVEEAAAVYAADLGISQALPRAYRHPGNVWALHGYHECLVKLGRTEEAKGLEKALKKALDGADVVIEASCFCRGVSGSVKVRGGPCCEKL